MSKVWNPTGGPDGKGRYEDAPADPNAPGNNGYSTGTAPVQGGPPTPNATPGRVMSPGSWGGYSGQITSTPRLDENGNPMYGPDGEPLTDKTYDTRKSGRADDVNRLREMAEKADARPAYELNYGNANADAALGDADRARQEYAINMTNGARNTALGKNTIAQDLGRRTLGQGADMQTAGALSARGGAMAQVAALQGRNNSVGAFRQRGEANLAAAKADEMEAGRSQFMDMASAKRAGDVAAQAANAKQAIEQGKMQEAQNSLNDKGSLDYELKAKGINEMAQDAALAAGEQQQGIDAAAMARGSRRAAGDVQFYRDSLQQVDSALPGASGGSKPPPDDATSDRKAKRMANLYGGR
jgi:hypothetical protein